MFEGSFVLGGEAQGDALDVLSGDRLTGSEGTWRHLNHNAPYLAFWQTETS
ncbi:MAG: hypothetical protein SNJ84_08950 [Verrucomicrobiia bacterium]